MSENYNNKKTTLKMSENYNNKKTISKQQILKWDDEMAKDKATDDKMTKEWITKENTTDNKIPNKRNKKKPFF